MSKKPFRRSGDEPLSRGFNEEQMKHKKNEKTMDVVAGLVVSLRQ